EPLPFSELCQTGGAGWRLKDVRRGPDSCLPADAVAVRGRISDLLHLAAVARGGADRGCRGVLRPHEGAARLPRARGFGSLPAGRRTSRIEMARDQPRRSTVRVVQDIAV